MALLKKTPPPQLDAERIRQFRAEADAWIDSRADALAAESPGVPIGVLRNILTNRAFGCQCQAVLNLLERDV